MNPPDPPLPFNRPPQPSPHTQSQRAARTAVAAEVRAAAERTAAAEARVNRRRLPHQKQGFFGRRSPSPRAVAPPSDLMELGRLKAEQRRLQVRTFGLKPGSPVTLYTRVRPNETSDPLATLCQTRPSERNLGSTRQPLHTHASLRERDQGFTLRTHIPPQALERDRNRVSRALGAGRQGRYSGYGQRTRYNQRDGYGPQGVYNSQYKGVQYDDNPADPRTNIAYVMPAIAIWLMLTGLRRVLTV